MTKTKIEQEQVHLDDRDIMKIAQELSEALAPLSPEERRLILKFLFSTESEESND